MGLPTNSENIRERQRDEVELDLGRYELRRRGRRVKLAKKGMELLIFLAGRREQLVSRKDIETRLWQAASLIDAERNINNLVRKIRRALGDDTSKTTGWEPSWRTSACSTMPAPCTSEAGRSSRERK